MQSENRLELSNGNPPFHKRVNLKGFDTPIHKSSFEPLGAIHPQRLFPQLLSSDACDLLEILPKSISIIGI